MCRRKGRKHLTDEYLTKYKMFLHTKIRVILIIITATSDEDSKSSKTHYNYNNTM